MRPHFFTERELAVLEGLEAAGCNEEDWRHRGRHEGETFLELVENGLVRAVIAERIDDDHVIRGARLTSKGRHALERARRDAAQFAVRLADDEAEKVQAFLHLFEREKARLAEMGEETDDVLVDAQALTAQMASRWPKREVVRALVIGIGYRFEQMKAQATGHLLTDPTMHALWELRHTLI